MISSGMLMSFAEVSLKQKMRNKLRTNKHLRKLKAVLDIFSDSRQSPHKSVVEYLNSDSEFFIFDVGANVGQFGLDIRRNGFSGKIFSFEPVQEIYSKLLKTSSSYQPWDTYQLALGQAASWMEINVSGNSGLSTSLLPMLPIHIENFPESVFIRKELVEVSTVDRQLEILGLLPDKLLLKLDVQGFEFEVLKGASSSLDKIPFCFLEVSLTSLYDNESTLLPILNHLASSGHQVVEVFRGVRSKEGKLLQVDILTKLSSK
jgi:FkbM family methyltransferase